jgi:hypothetical protein
MRRGGIDVQNVLFLKFGPEKRLPEPSHLPQIRDSRQPSDDARRGELLRENVELFSFSAEKIFSRNLHPPSPAAG